MSLKNSSKDLRESEPEIFKTFKSSILWQKQKRFYNITRRLCFDVFSAAVASFTVSPFITAIDKSIIQNASGACRMITSLKLTFLDIFTTPHRFFLKREFRLMFGVYFLTYIAANIMDTIGEGFYGHQIGTSKFIAISIVNTISCISKDRAYTRMFGIVKPTALPYLTYLLFGIRDCGTIFASFILPPVFSYLFQIFSNMKKVKADNISQFVGPISIQFFSSPLHLFGLDLYNHPSKCLFSSRFNRMIKNYPLSTMARAGRIGPAFGFGGVFNRMCRDSLLETETPDITLKVNG